MGDLPIMCSHVLYLLTGKMMINMNKPMDRSQLTSHHDKFLLTILYPLVAKRGNGKMPRIRSLNKYDEIWEDHL